RGSAPPGSGTWPTPGCLSARGSAPMVLHSPGACPALGRSLDGLPLARLHFFQIVETSFRNTELWKLRTCTETAHRVGATGVRIRWPKQEYSMARMTAARAAVEILKREGV